MLSSLKGDDAHLEKFYILNHIYSQNVNADNIGALHRGSMEVAARGSRINEHTQPFASPRPITYIGQNSALPSGSNKMICFAKAVFAGKWLCPQNHFLGDNLFHCTSRPETGKLDIQSLADPRRQVLYRDAAIKALPSQMQEEIRQESQPGNLNIVFVQRIGRRITLNFDESVMKVSKAITDHFGHDPRWNITFRRIVPGGKGHLLSFSSSGHPLLPTPYKDMKSFDDHVRGTASAQIMIGTHGAGLFATLFLNPVPKPLLIEAVWVCPVCVFFPQYTSTLGVDYRSVCPVNNQPFLCNYEGDGNWNIAGIIDTLSNYLKTYYFP